MISSFFFSFSTRGDRETLKEEEEQLIINNE